MRDIRDVAILEDIPVLVRTSLNVPIVDGEIRNTFRLRKARKTIEYLQDRGARVIVCGHIGRDAHASLRPIYNYFNEKLSRVSFSDEVVGSRVREKVHDMHAGDILILENVRRQAGEIANDRAFAKELAYLADVFVQDAFDTCHRKHASIVGVPEYLPSYAGLLLQEEVQELSQALSPKHPALAIVGGAKFMTKMPFIDLLLDRYDDVFIGGALANDILQARGEEVGKSLVSGKSDSLNIVAMHEKIFPPRDVVVGSPSAKVHKKVGEVSKEDVIFDIGPETFEALKETIQKAQFILWNGPMGNYEDGFIEGTHMLAELIADTHAYSIIGGGDTVAAIDSLQIANKFSFISTGGGSMLDFISTGSLPGIDAIS